MGLSTPTKKPSHLIWRTSALVYGGVCYLIFLVAFLYLIGFVGDLFALKALDSGPGNPLIPALLIDVLLLGLFAAQHSVMARPAFKQWWTTLVPPAVERSTYVLFASLSLLLLYWQWLPIQTVVWDVDGIIGQVLLPGLFWMGWLIVFASSFFINHFDLFGLRQTFLHWLGKAYTPLGFRTPALYKLVRHPLMLGFFIAFWAAPQMTIGHLIFSLMATGYMLLGIHLEERDLLAFHGEAYQQYRQHVRLLVPLPKKYPVTPESEVMTHSH